MRDVRAGMSAEKAALKYFVSSRTIDDWSKQQRENGMFEPRHGRPGRKPKLTTRREEILAAVGEKSGITLKKLMEQLGLDVSTSTLWVALKRWGIVLKKSPQGVREATV